jgi:hypothetical protein
MNDGSYIREGKLIDSKYLIYYNSQNQEHRLNGPAIEYLDGRYAGTYYWRFCGKTHRIGGPATYRSNSIESLKYSWHRMSAYHRLNAPAIIHHDGNKEYWEFDIKQSVVCN